MSNDNFESIREICVHNLVETGQLTLDEADTLPTVDEFRQAHLACARELAAAAAKKAVVFTAEIHTDDQHNIANGFEIAAAFKLAAFLAVQAEKLRCPLTEEGSDFYCQNVREILDWRSGDAKVILVSASDQASEIGGLEQDFKFSEVFHHLAIGLKEPLQRPASLKRFDVAHFHPHGGRA